METIGFLELSSIACGVEIADAMLKAAKIKLIFSRASCPGKYYILISGQVSDVRDAIKEGEEKGGGFVVSSLVIAKVHPQVISAVNMSSMPVKVAAIGVMEFFSVAASLSAADIAVKAAIVELMDIRLGTGIGGKSFVVLTGETAAVTAAVEAAIQSQLDSGTIVHKTVIPNPRRELIASLF